MAAPLVMLNEMVPEAAPAPVTLSHTSDMIQNYVQGEVVSPTAKFEALQTDDGHSLLFQMSTDNVFTVIEEQSGARTTGWESRDLSTDLLASNFANDKKAVLRTFDVGQSAVDGTIGMAVAVSSGGSDHLFLSLSNSSSDVSWTTKPSWVSVPYDAPVSGTTKPLVTIVGIMFAETKNKKQYIMVDIDRSTTNAKKDIARYFIDPSKPSGKWSQHNVPVDIEDGNYQSCVGRIPGQFVDGVYTSGTSGASAQLVYVPVMNPFGGPPTPSRFSLPDGAQASAITSARNVDAAPSSKLYGTTDLYAIGGSTLYRFAAEKQEDGAVGTALLTDDLFSGTTKLSSMTHDGLTTIWGKNGSDQVYYVSCHSTQLSDPGSWSAPLPILTGIEQMSPYINRTDGGNTIFASGGNKLRRLIQATDTDAKIWRADEIKLESPPTEKSLSFNSYTTTIQLLDGQNLPASGAEVIVTAASRAPAYINGLYYVLSPAQISVTTDATGTVTVIEPVHKSINGTILRVSCDHGATFTTINPMDKSFKTMAALNTEKSLRGAQFPTNTVAGGTLGTPASAPLVASSTSSDDATAAAKSMDQLNAVYGSVNSTPAHNLPAAHALLATPRVSATHVPRNMFHASPAFRSVGHEIAVALGDVLNWVESGIEFLVEVVKDAAEATWSFLVTIAGKVYRAVLKTVDAVVAAVQMVFKAIKTAVEDVIHFLEFLFDWDDVKRTKEVLHNLTKQWLQGRIGDIQTGKQLFNEQITNLEVSINEWAGITDWSTSIGQVAAQPVSAKASDPTAGHTSGSQMLSNHYKNHGSNLAVKGTTPDLDPTQQIIDDLLSALEQEGEVLSAVYSQLKNLAKDFASLSVGQILQKLVAIFADGLLSSIEVVADTIFNILVDLAQTALGLLDTKIHIPIISDILNAIGIPDISFLDLLCWVPAVAYTVIYKIAEDKAPFPDNAEVQSLINADSWETLQSLLGSQPPPPPSALREEASVMHAFAAAPLAALLSERPDAELLTVPKAPSSSIIPISDGVAKTLYVAGHSIAGFMSLMSVFVSGFEAELPNDENPWGIPSAVIGVIGAASGAIADMALPKDPIQNEGFKILSEITSAATILAKVIFSGPVQNRFKASSKMSFLTPDDGRATGSVVNVVLVIPALCVTIEHFCELGKYGADVVRSAAIVGEVSNVTSYVSRVSYSVAVNDPEEVTKQVAIGIMTAANLAVAGLQTAEAVIH